MSNIQGNVQEFRPARGETPANNPVDLKKYIKKGTLTSQVQNGRELSRHRPESNLCLDLKDVSLSIKASLARHFRCHLTGFGSSSAMEG